MMANQKNGSVWKYIVRKKLVEQNIRLWYFGKVDKH